MSPFHTIYNDDDMDYMCMAGTCTVHFLGIGVARTMPISKPKPRLCADPCIGVGDLLLCIEGVLDEIKDNNLYGYLDPGNKITVSWKNAPNPVWLSRLTLLWGKFLAIAPNGVLPSKKCRVALEKLVERRDGVNLTKKSTEDYAIKCDDWIRLGLSHLRSMKQSDVAKQRCLRKCDPDESSKIEDILAKLDLDTGMDTQQDPPGDSQNQTLTLAVVPCEETPAEETTAPSSSSKGDTSVSDPLSIFEAVNSRKSIFEGSPGSKQSPKKKGNTSLGPNELEFDGFLSGLISVGAVDADYAAILADSKKQEPINKGFKSQLQKANKALKKKKMEEMEEEGESLEDRAMSGKKKNKMTSKKPKNKQVGAKNQSSKKVTTPAAKSTAKSNKQQDQKCGDDKKAKKEKKQQMKRKKNQPSEELAQPEEAPEETEEPEEEKQQDQQDSVAPGEDEDHQKKKKAPKKKKSKKMKQKVPEGYGFDPCVSRSINRKRFTSRHWHHGKALGLKAGMNEEDSNEKGREHSQWASKKFDEVWPKKKKAKAVDVD